MHKKIRLYVFIAVALGLSIGGLFLAGNRFGSIAGSPAYWITVDENELSHIRSVAREKGGAFDLEIIERRGSIAVIKADELQISGLSTAMHDEFHKCAGFMTHESREKAVASAEEALRADVNQQFVEYTINNQPNVTPLLAETQEPQILQITNDLAAFPNRRHNQQSGLDSANWIKNKWTQLAAGRSDITVEFFTHPTNITPQPSIILTIQGTSLPSDVVVLGAHQDSINSSGQTADAPGADDDASGVASLTEAIRVIVAKNFRPQRTVKFMAYAAEEVGLRGSNAIAADYQTNSVGVMGVLQLDMTNYKSANSTIDIAIFTDFTNAAQNQFIRDLITAYQPNLTFGNSACGYGCSDHASWHNKGFPASFPHESTFPNSNPNIHKITDTVSQSGNNANHAVKFTKLALSYVGELAKGQIITAAPDRARMDYDGDGKSDVSVFRPATSVWYLNRSQAGFTATAFGTSGDQIVPADYDGDGKTDIAVYRGGVWYQLRSQLGFTALPFGAGGDIPQPEDFDGDGKADLAVFRPSEAKWYQLRSQAGLAVVSFGISTDKPIPADYDGDGKSDVAVFRNGTWVIQQSQDGLKTVNFGLPTDKPLVGDFDGDGKTDISVFRDGAWHQLRSSAGYVVVSFGLATDIPAVGDYDGDGKSDVAVFRPENGGWYILNSLNGSIRIEGFGLAGDIPTPAAFQQ